MESNKSRIVLLPFYFATARTTLYNFIKRASFHKNQHINLLQGI